MLSSLPFTLPDLHAAYRSGTKASAVIDECLRRLAVVDDPGIFISLTPLAELYVTLAELGPFDPQTKPLWGIPFAVKDNIDLAGHPTTAACPDYAYEPEQDAFVVARLKAAGAICLGKTNLDQFATGLVGVRTPYPAPRNSLDPELIPGGSSSGSGVAVAQGIVCFALGTDTAGSGRVPAALNGIVGLKPSLGRLSSVGSVPACRSLDTLSVFALTVEDAWRVFSLAAAYDQNDAFARPFQLPPLACPETPRIGIPSVATRRFFQDAIQAEAFEADLAQLTALGANLVELDFSLLYEAAELLYDGAWVAERYAAVGPFIEAQPDAVLPVTARIIQQARQFSAKDAFRDLYHLHDIRRALQHLMAQIDFLCVPSLPRLYRVDELECDPFGPNTVLGTYTNFVNLLDLCALTVPTPARSDGWPGSITLLAKSGLDARIAQFALRLQQHLQLTLGATDWPLPAPTLPDPAPLDPTQEITLAVVGAHMRGLPLNKELTRLGARFLYASHTAPDYRFYLLAGGPPFRPGLIRTEQDGARIALEVWALPRQQMGEFIAGVPAPLGIGTLTLDNGTQVKGFICEAIGAVGAREITAFGGWRTYLDASTQSITSTQATTSSQSTVSSHSTAANPSGELS